MTESPTMPIPIVLSPEAMTRLRRQTREDRARQHDLDRAGLGKLLTPSEALTICARMVDRWTQTEEEAKAVRELMRRHHLNGGRVLAEWRRLTGMNSYPPARIPGAGR